ncbi:MAG: hypothetical protein ACJ78Q_05590 [Chloroflexia bacterium]
MEDEGKVRLLAMFTAFMIAAAAVAGIMSYSYFSFNALGSALAQPKYTFPYSTPAYQIPTMLTPLSFPTFSMDWNLYDFSTPTPVHGDVYVTSP